MESERTIKSLEREIERLKMENNSLREEINDLNIELDRIQDGSNDDEMYELITDLQKLKKQYQSGLEQFRVEKEIVLDKAKKTIEEFKLNE